MIKPFSIQFYIKTFFILITIYTYIICRQTNINLYFDFSWFKLDADSGDKTAVELGDRIRQVGGTLIIREARVLDSGKYLCEVQNSVGAESVETVLTVTG